MILEVLRGSLDRGKPWLLGSVALGMLFVGTDQALLAQQDQPRRPMQARLEDGAEYRWLNKKVLDCRLLDNMENLANWSFKGDGDMTLSDSYKKDGQHSLRIQSAFNIARVDGSGEWEDLIATRKFPSEDWRKYNRISLWVYAEVAGAPALAASLRCITRARTSCRISTTKAATNRSSSRTTPGPTWFGRSRRSIAIKSRHSISLTACRRCFPMPAITPFSTSIN